MVESNSSTPTVPMGVYKILRAVKLELRNNIRLSVMVHSIIKLSTEDSGNGNRRSMAHSNSWSALEALNSAQSLLEPAICGSSSIA
jgi:hypothetical protein